MYNASTTDPAVLLPHQRDKQTNLSEIKFAEVLKMEKSKEYKICVGLLSVSLVLYLISMVTGLIPGLLFSIDKICMYLGTSFFCFGLVFLKKSKDNDDKDE